MHPELYRLLRGHTPLRAPNDDRGNEPTVTPEPDDEPVTPPVTPPTPPAPAPSGNPPTDSEARLIKDVMKHKDAAKRAKDEAEAAARRLAEFDGIDPAEYRRWKTERDDAERTAAEARGDYDRVLASVREQNAAAIAEAHAERDAARAENATANKRIDELTIGRAFGDSKFLAEQTVLSPAKARRLFDDHFEIVDGEIVAYDKPASSSSRTRLVDARGEDLSFEAAIEKIVKADADYDRLARSSTRPGSGTVPREPIKVPDNKPALKGVAAIGHALANRRK